MKTEIDGMVRDLKHMIDGETWHFSEHDEVTGDYVSLPPPAPEVVYLLKRARVDLEEARRLLELSGGLKR